MKAFKTSIRFLFLALLLASLHGYLRDIATAVDAEVFFMTEVQFWIGFVGLLFAERITNLTVRIIRRTH